jgi:hypothetical protein
MEINMSVTSIIGGVSEVSLKPVAQTVASVHQAKEVSANSEAAAQAAQVVAAGATGTHKVAPLAKQETHDKDKSKDDAAQHMSHVIEVYNTQGKKRLKFMDSRNNVIYQVPSETVAKMEDLMLKPDTSASKNG